MLQVLKVGLCLKGGGVWTCLVRGSSDDDHSYLPLCVHATRPFSLSPTALFLSTSQPLDYHVTRVCVNQEEMVSITNAPCVDYRFGDALSPADHHHRHHHHDLPLRDPFISQICIPRRSSYWLTASDTLYEVLGLQMQALTEMLSCPLIVSGIPRPTSLIPHSQC